MSATQGTLAALQARSEGALAEGTLRPEESLDAVWQHLREGLMALAEKGGPGQEDLPEDGLTQRLTIHLERSAHIRPYFFLREDLEDDRDGSSPRADLGVRARDDSHILLSGIRYSGGQRFLALEAKRLPTPGTGREREYLKGKRGGVERFKRGLHARELATVGIIAYVQRYGFGHWHQLLNDWVDELIAASTQELPWDEQDRLELETASDRLAQLRSGNLRVSDNRRLTMRHIWVQLGPGVAQAGENRVPRSRRRPTHRR
jgi:hypothetical protein